MGRDAVSHEEAQIFLNTPMIVKSREAELKWPFKRGGKGRQGQLTIIYGHKREAGREEMRRSKDRHNSFGLQSRKRKYNQRLWNSAGSLLQLQLQ